MNDLFGNVYEGLPVLITGHTGFKGSWLAAWLLALGADVVGFSLPEPPTTPSNFARMGLADHLTDLRGDVRDAAAVQQVVAEVAPRIVFHLAGQPIVLRSVEEPLLTFDTNAGGTANVLEAIRTTDAVRALVSVTTDKVYADQEWTWGYRENDRLGGFDPYSASKAMAELAVAAYRNTIFPPDRYDEHGVAVATVRAGNVIGGGDFGAYRLVPDCMRALLAGEPIEIRNPLSVRPWQHVLVPLSGYLWLGAQLLREGARFAEAWNFGPPERQGITTQRIAERLIALWGEGSWVHTRPGHAKLETGYLRLSWEKAATFLDWHPVYTWEDALAEIVAWFQAFRAGDDMHGVVRSHIAAYVERARAQGVGWTA